MIPAPIRPTAIRLIVAVACLGPGVTAAQAQSEYRLIGSAAHPRHTNCSRPATSSRRQGSRTCHVTIRRYASSARAHTRRTKRVVHRAVVPPAEASSAQTSLASVLATPCENTQLMPESGNLALIREAVLCLINKKRAENGEQPLKENAQLDAAGESHVQEMLQDDYFAHVSPSGVTPVDRATASGYIQPGPDGYVVGENIAWGTLSLATPQAIVDAWIASPGHLANILEGQYRDTGIVVSASIPAGLADGVPGALYAQEFGVITH